MRVLVEGLGSIGRRHLQNLARSGVTTDLVGHDPRSSEDLDLPADLVASATLFTGGIEVPTSRRFDAALVCTPPETHLTVAMELMNRGLQRLLVEKPLASTVVEGEGILEQAELRGVAVTVGYMLRFSPGLRRLRSNAPLRSIYHARGEFGYCWTLWRATPATYQAPILLEASHELDLVEWLTRDRVRAVSGMEDPVNADGLLWMRSGIVVSLHLDAINPRYTRRWSVLTVDGELGWSLDDPSDAAPWYGLEVADWLNGGSWGCSGADALQVLRIVEAWRTSSRMGGQVVPVWR